VDATALLDHPDPHLTRGWADAQRVVDEAERETLDGDAGHAGGKRDNPSHERAVFEDDDAVEAAWADSDVHATPEGRGPVVIQEIRDQRGPCSDAAILQPAATSTTANGSAVAAEFEGAVMADDGAGDVA
jgi:hypothetical protein